MFIKSPTCLIVSLILKRLIRASKTNFDVTEGPQICRPSSSLSGQKRADLCPPPSDLALGDFARRILVNGHLVEFVHLVGGVERVFELRARGIGAHQPHLQKEYGQTKVIKIGKSTQSNTSSESKESQKHKRYSRKVGRL